MQDSNTYTGKIVATVFEGPALIVKETHLLNMATKEGRYALRQLADKTHNAGRSLMTAPVTG